MTDKILEAVKALGGDLRNTENYSDRYSIAIVMGFTRADGEVDYYQAKEKSTSDHRWFVACTIDEFNTYAEQWLKEAYMHNAALDCNWDLYYRDGSKLICTSDDIVVHFDVDVCTKQEFIDYCNTNKPQKDDKVEWGGEGLPPIGCDVLMMVEADVFNIIRVVAYKGSVAWVDFGEEFDTQIINTNDWLIKPIQSPRDKAIDEMQEDCKQGGNKLVVGLCGKLYDAGYRKLTPEQRKEFDL